MPGSTKLESGETGQQIKNNLHTKMKCSVPNSLKITWINRSTENIVINNKDDDINMTVNNNSSKIFKLIFLQGIF